MDSKDPLHASPVEIRASDTGAIAEDEFEKIEENACGKKEHLLEKSVSPTDFPERQDNSSGRQSASAPSDPLQTIKSLSACLTASITTSLLNIPPSGLDQDSVRCLLEGFRSSSTVVNSLLSNLPSAAIPVGDFVRFSRLPLELRRIIWKFALPGPQVVKVTTGHYENDVNRHEKLKINVGLPNLMHVCRESRQICLEKYSVKLACETRLPSDCARFDPEDDTIYIPDLGLCFDAYRRRLSDQALGAIKVLIVKWDNYCEYLGEPQKVDEAINFTLLTSLQQIVIVMDTYSSVEYSDYCERKTRPLSQDITLEDSPLSDSHTRELRENVL